MIVASAKIFLALWARVLSRRRLASILAALFLSCCSQAPTPEWCKKACGLPGVVDYSPQEGRDSAGHKWVITCADGAFFSTDTPEKCVKRGGVVDRTDIGDIEQAGGCLCGDGAWFER